MDGWESSGQPWLLLAGAAYSLPVSADEVVDEDADLQLCQAHPGAHPWPAPEPQEAVRLERFLREISWHQHTLSVSSLPATGVAVEPELAGNLRRICWG